MLLLMLMINTRKYPETKDIYRLFLVGSLCFRFRDGDIWIVASSSHYSKAIQMMMMMMLSTLILS